MEKWFHVIGIGYVFCTSNAIRASLPHWRIEETAHSGVAYK